MNKLHTTRLDDRLNAVLIAIATATLLVLTVDAVRGDRAQRATAALLVSTPAAPAATTAAATLIGAAVAR